MRSLLTLDPAAAVPKPGTILAAFAPAGQPLSALPQADALPFQVAILAGDTAGRLAHDAGVRVARTPDGRQSVYFSGVLVRPERAEPAQTTLAAYQQFGADFARHLSGNFTVFVVDEAAGRILVATDRINSTKILYSTISDTLVLSNNGDLHPSPGLQPDETAIAFFLASGFFPGTHTLLEPVRLLDGGTVATVRGNTLNTESYWRFEQTSTTSKPVETLKQEFADRLIEAVRLRLPRHAPVYISLSAGGDSRAILGILAESLRVPNVRSFSYAHGPIQPDSDEALSRQAAALYGYEHRIIESFEGKLPASILRAAHLGGGLGGVCDEVDSWVSLASEVSRSDAERPVMFTGETVNMRADYHVTNVDDVVAAAKMKHFGVLDWLEPLVGRSRYTALAERTDSAIDALVQACPPSDDLISMRFMLALQQRHRIFLPWREYYAGRAFTVGLPMLDDDLVDFVLQLPASAHRGRRLYEEVVTERYPALFAIPRAKTSSYASYWPSALRQQAQDVIAFIRSHDSPLDSVIEPDVLLRALDMNSAWRNRTQALLTKTLTKSFRLLRRTRLRESRLTTASSVKRPVEPHTFLKRALTLRTALAIAAERHNVTPRA